MFNKKEASSVVLFDIDGTLFDVTSFKNRIIEVIGNFFTSIGRDDVGAKTVLSDFRRSLQTGSEYSHAGLVDFIANRFYLTKQEKERLFLALKLIENDQSQWLYPEVESIITHLRTRGVRIGIFSQSSHEAHQRRKFESVKSAFTDKLIFIVPNKISLEVLVRLPQDALIIDDKPTVIQALLDYNQQYNKGWRLVLIDRHNLVDETTRNKLKQRGVKIIQQLKELLNDH